MGAVESSEKLLTLLEIGDGVLIFYFLSLFDANQLRLTNRKIKELVSKFRWKDQTPVLNLSRWRLAFPNAIVCVVHNSVALTVVNAPYWVGCEEVSVVCRNRLADFAFKYFRGVRKLTIAMLGEINADGMLVHLQGIHTLDLTLMPDLWRKLSITNAAFAHLAGIHTLKIRCRGPLPITVPITDAMCMHLQGIHTLDLSGGSPPITDAAFAHLAGIHELNISGCSQETITDAAFAHLAGIHTLNMDRCNQETITDAAFAHLAGIHTLSMSGCSQETITDTAFAHLAGIHTLVIDRQVRKQMSI